MSRSARLRIVDVRDVRRERGAGRGYQEDGEMSEYTLYHIGVSGGKDSTALLLWAVNESGYPRDRIVASFCDTGNEHQITYDYVRMLSDKVFHIPVGRKEKAFSFHAGAVLYAGIEVIPNSEIHQSVDVRGRETITSFWCTG